MRLYLLGYSLNLMLKTPAKPPQFALGLLHAANAPARQTSRVLSLRCLLQGVWRVMVGSGRPARCIPARWAAGCLKSARAMQPSQHACAAQMRGDCPGSQAQRQHLVTVNQRSRDFAFVACAASGRESPSLATFVCKQRACGAGWLLTLLVWRHSPSEPN